MRDNFSQQIKRALGDRVAWKCCFPGCTEITIGPGSNDENHVLKLGEAAHITAASLGGPRYDPNITSEQRKSIINAILLCNKHATLIDKDFTQYSADTLRQWKAQAEEKAHHDLISPNSNDSTTLISIGASIICEAEWKSINSNLWTFNIGKFIKGSRDLLFEYSMTFNSMSPLNKYLIFERQGDGRIIDNISLSEKENRLETGFSVRDKFPSQDPNNVGGDIAMSEEGGISFFKNDFKMVTGVDAAKQAIRLTLGSSIGDWRADPLTGSYFSEYYQDYKNDLLTLERLLKLEVTRLLSIPVYGGYPPSFEPQLPFIKRILSVKVQGIPPLKKQVPILLKGEWGNGDLFEESFKIFL